MSKKHYIQLAALVAKYSEQLPAIFVAELAVTLKEDNPRFDAGRFLQAAAYPELIGTKQGLN